MTEEDAEALCNFLELCNSLLNSIYISVMQCQRDSNVFQTDGPARSPRSSYCCRRLKKFSVENSSAIWHKEKSRNILSIFSSPIVTS
jgi:hypothetical protein